MTRGTQMRKRGEMPTGSRLRIEPPPRALVKARAPVGGGAPVLRIVAAAREGGGDAWKKWQRVKPVRVPTPTPWKDNGIYYCKRIKRVEEDE